MLEKVTIVEIFSRLNRIWEEKRRKEKKWKLGSFHWRKFELFVFLGDAKKVQLFIFFSPKSRFARKSPESCEVLYLREDAEFEMWHEGKKQINASGCTYRRQRCPWKRLGQKKSHLPWHLTWNISVNDSEASQGWSSEHQDTRQPITTLTRNGTDGDRRNVWLKTKKIKIKNEKESEPPQEATARYNLDAQHFIVMSIRGCLE